MTLPNISTLTALGGPWIDAIAIVDPTSEVSSASLNSAFSDLASMTAVSPRWLFQFVGASSSPSIASSATWTAGCDSVAGNAPAVRPVLTRSGPGVVLVQLPATITNPLGTVITNNIRAARGSLMGTTPGFVQCVVTSASTFTINLYASSGAAADLVGSLVFCEVY